MRAACHIGEGGLCVGERKDLVHDRLHAVGGDRIDHRLQILDRADRDALQPLLLVVMGVVIAFLLMSLYMPLFNLSSLRSS